MMLPPSPRYRVLVTGSRAWTDPRALTEYLDDLLARHRQRLVIVHGDCRQGVDALADRWARAHGVPVQRYPALWHLYGHRAGLIRNEHMVATAPDMCGAFIENTSPGATLARAAGIPTFCLHRGGAA